MSIIMIFECPKLFLARHQANQCYFFHSCYIALKRRRRQTGKLLRKKLVVEKLRLPGPAMTQRPELQRRQPLASKLNEKWRLRAAPER